MISAVGTPLRQALLALANSSLQGKRYSFALSKVSQARRPLPFVCCGANTHYSTTPIRYCMYDQNVEKHTVLAMYCGCGSHVQDLSHANTNCNSRIDTFWLTTCQGEHASPVQAAGNDQEQVCSC